VGFKLILLSPQMWKSASKVARRFTPAFQRRMFSDEALKKTALYDAHVELQGKIVPFGGWALPVQYGKESIGNSHLHVRSKAGLFDVSHMGQLILRGNKAADFLEYITPADIGALETNQARLSLLTNEAGGIIDDCMITKKDGHIYMVINAGCIDKDLAHMHAELAKFNEKNGGDVSIEYLQDRALLALQGPKAAEILQGLVPSDYDVASQDFMYTRHSSIGKFNDCWIARCGYTGEDGFEISVPNADAIAFMHSLLESEHVHPAGLGVRDSLRLEAGLCLYGHDLNETTSPIEATLGWTITKRRKEAGGFIGYETIRDHIKNGVSRKRVGLEVVGGAPAREGAEILSAEGEVIGEITSGTLSPLTKKKISMGYVKTGHHKNKTPVQVRVRGKANDAVITKMPFVPSNYYKKPQ